MKQVLRHIFDRKRAYQRLPLFEWMRDETLTPRARLAFYPCMAPFIMSFGDLNKFILREERPANAFQEMVNAHTLEDDHHWPWYLEDFSKLGFDAEMRGTAWMNFLWGEETLQNRVLMARLTALISGTSSLERLVIIEAIEETGNVLFATMLPLAVALEQQIGEELRYCGPFHFNLESGHAVGADHKVLAAKSSVRANESGASQWSTKCIPRSKLGHASSSATRTRIRPRRIDLSIRIEHDVEGVVEVALKSG